MNNKICCGNCKYAIDFDDMYVQCNHEKMREFYPAVKISRNSECSLYKSEIDYWDNITEIQEKQTAKGIKKYGDILENNPTNLDVFERLRYIQEELIDALMYIEHLKIKLKEK